MSEPLLRVDGLGKTFGGGGRFRRTPAVQAVREVSFTLDRGETLGLVGESGCGKSTLARLILRLLDPTTGQIVLDGEDITSLTGDALRRTRRRMQMIFQDPFASLNPRMTLKSILAEPLRAHGIDRATWTGRMHRVLHDVGLPATYLGRYAHELSGGQRQRVGIARALLLEPDLLLADEPVAALDVSIQAQILNLLRDLQRDRGIALLFISHDLAVVPYISDRIGVMYLGHLVELADRDALFDHPLHPYTRTLLDAAPSLHRPRSRPAAPDGEPPSPTHPPPGCSFHPRCPLAMPVCRETMPTLDPHPGPRSVACHAVPTGTDAEQP